MDFVKVQLDRIQQQLSSLSATQKLLTAALVAIMVMTVAWWTRVASTPEMETLLNQSLSDEEVSRITGRLEASGIEYQLSSDHKVLVGADRRIRALAVLGYADALPKNTSSGLDDMIKQLSPWDGQAKTDMLYNRGREMLLGEVIRNFPEVASATVALDPDAKRQIGGNIESTAFVAIQMKNGARPGKGLVNAAGNVVAGAQAGLLLKNIRVVIDGVPQRIREPEDAAGGADADTISEITQKWEQHYTDKVATQLAGIPGVMVAVTVKVNNRSEVMRSHKFEKIEKQESQIKESHKESTEAPPPPQEPGVASNIGTNTAPAAVAGAGQTESEELTTFAHFPTTVDTESSTPAGEATPVSACVSIPRAYFARIAKGNSPNEPDEAAIDARMKVEIPRIQEMVRACTALKKTDDITIFTLHDALTLAPPMVQASAASSITLALGSYSKEIVLGLLALVSLFLVSTIVKKGTPLPFVLPPLPAPGPAALLGSGEAIAGEVGGGDPMLDGMELDDDAVRTQQMIEQVSTMVKENPDAAASLVKRWLNK